MGHVRGRLHAASAVVEWCGQPQHCIPFKLKVGQAEAGQGWQARQGTCRGYQGFTTSGWKGSALGEVRGGLDTACALVRDVEVGHSE